MTRQKRNGTVYPAKIVTISAKREGGLFGDGGAPMRMRFLPIAILLLGAFPPPSVAQSRVAQVAALLSVPVSDSSQGPVWQAFVDELRKRGRVEGHNLAFDVRSAGGRAEHYPELAAELVALRPDVIIAVGTQPVQAVHEKKAMISRRCSVKSGGEFINKASGRLRAITAKAASRSSDALTSIGSIVTPSCGAIASKAALLKRFAGLSGTHKKPIREIPGRTSVSSWSTFPMISPNWLEIPVTLPPGRAKLSM